MALDGDLRLDTAVMRGTCHNDSPEIGLYQCLIVSTDLRRRQMLSEAAREAGWQTVVCGDCDSALETIRRVIVRLGVVDLQNKPRREFESLLEEMAPNADLLLVVCGNEGNVREEIWVRQLGAWLYLPGVEQHSDLTMLCQEARLLTERLNQARSLA